MSFRINEVHTRDIKKVPQKKTNKKIEVFTSDPTKVEENKQNWDCAHYETINSWDIKSYKWSNFKDTDDAIEKSQQSLIDLLRYYEGDAKNNYKAKQKFKDLNGKGTTTFGYGITQMPKSICTLTPPKSEKEAYNILILYLDKVSYKETKNLFKNEWNEFPESLKEALIDFNFNKGCKLLSSKKEAIIKAYKNNDWATILKNLVYAYPGSSKAEKTEEAGLYKRSLSRVILALRDIKKTDEINKIVEDIYNKAVNCAKKQGKDIAEINKIYDAFLNNGKISKKTDVSQKNAKNYDINEEITVYSLALSLRPPGQNSECLKEIINEIIKLNNISVDEFDKNGFPKCRSINNESISLPKSINLNGKKINLNTPTKYKESSKAETKAETKIQAQPKEVHTEKNRAAKVEENNSAAVEQENNNNTTTTEKEYSFFKKAEILFKLSYAVIKIKTKEFIFGKADKSEGKEEEENKTPFESLLESENTTIEEDGDFQIITTKYQIKKGDNIWRLAQTYNLDEENLCDMNNIEDKNKIIAGNSLNIQKLGYKVKEGDKLTEISEKFGIDIETIKDLNNLENEMSIKANQILELPGYIYVVKKNETLSSIAKKVGMSVNTLMKVNKLNSTTIYPNDKIKVVYDEMDYSIPESRRTVSIDTKTNNKIETINMGTSKGLEKRPLLQNKTKINGKVVATRKVFKPEKSTKPRALDNRTILINAGHGYNASGGIDCGTPGLEGLEHEYLLNYDNAIRLKDELCKQGATVIFLQGKRNLIYDELAKKRNKADLFISIHVNSGGKNPTDRTEVYIRTEDFKAKNKSNRFANIIEKNFDTWISKNETIKPKDKFISPLTNTQDYAQIRHESRKTQGKYYRLGLLDKAQNSLGNIPSIIWEVAYMNTSKGRERLSNKKLMENYAQIMSNSIVEVLTTKKKS